MTTMMKTLTEAVRIATGIPDAMPRPGQATLTEHIEEAIKTTGHVVGVAPTGLGKSLSLLAPAMVAAAELGQRTIISTESLSLQAQIMDKDAPNAAAACEKVTGTRPDVALLKGFSNYLCLAAVRDTAEALTGTAGARLTKPELRTKLAGLKKTGYAQLDGRSFDLAKGVPLLTWALSLRDDDPGDKQSYEGDLTNELWGAVSVGPSECIGDTCPLFDYCKPKKARAKAAEADIVVTNHSMLAVQAAKGVPVLVGNKNLGEFHIIMVDEAHALPENVRNAGASEVSVSSVTSLARSITRVLDEFEPRVERLVKEGKALALELNDELAALGRGTKPGEVRKVTENEDPVENTGDMMIAWAKSVKGALEVPSSSSNTKIRLAAKRLTGRMDTFIANISAVKLHKTGVARWIEMKNPPKDARNQTPYWVASSSPVNVGGMLLANLWTAPELPDEEDPVAQAMKEAGEPVEEEAGTYPMTVIAVSATLPGRFGYQAGMSAENVNYPSPFDKAYGSSLLYIPKLAGAELQELYPGWAPGRRARFDARLHEGWAARKNVELVEAAHGRALILSAKSSSGERYARELRAAAKGRWKVYSQWDGQSTRYLMSAWRDDEHAVLVGTKSLMTGVDAPGRTCSLVTVDRIPRQAGNPVGDARVEALMEALQTDKWSADRLVYVAEAALLLEQAAGRLIRSMGDVGMFAVLDPRFLKTGPVSYPEMTRRVYKKAVERFLRVTTSHKAAVEFLETISESDMGLAA
ncbi:ATP-dependent DNA helicase [Arthrobacter sp. zg-Y1110]|uniref:ATP-dependent DNA helicase n=1 Tax=Arthrobacter sp. zg-Y1110 TaxID=2886932 RepID=UPI001D15A9EA|nr:ATP-dependent DNA helicase [Arthrobacter sp. zg-Y1110]MCC3292844.1 ATP-dependent DNA helicase [Arthrobacter sp. zg-Y1110]UWX86783.1 ATP-dependent DNA helicase [Arthrobacter sp. zg-Y1110]